ncbi:hypothetical protein BDP81DRAFT_470750 [Colletotrichum phormii]|uniref:Transcription factor domain-containing protein n=1 Tax=Colletotrichum phormii TaxID=359342 RepID=A0AAJ0EH15_9PEZI|nr:uncharacterized protein BDP81DRAFT_470750 [Colletotrichum phormii]KAK1638529.1 hypothetical protein BDP81DRAFT_470750 [Colletotrichum phormii]
MILHRHWNESKAWWKAFSQFLPWPRYYLTGIYLSLQVLYLCTAILALKLLVQMFCINSCYEAQVDITRYRINGNRSLISRTRTVVPQNMRHACLESENVTQRSLSRMELTPELTPELLGFISASPGVWSMFQLGELIAAFRDYEYEVISPLPSVCAAVNIVCAYALRINGRDKIDWSDYCLHNALDMLPAIMTELPDSIAIGTLLLMTLIFASTSRLPTAAMILAIASQMMFLAGFHKMTATPDETTTHKRRLLSYAYILDQNLSLWLEKPPLLSSNFGLDLLEQEPYDGQGTIHLRDGISVNCLREQVILAKFQSKAYATLRSPDSSSMSQEAYAEISRQLLEEPLQWRSNLPALVEPLLIPNDLDKKHAPWLSAIFCTFYQVEIAIRSSIFSHKMFFDNADFRNQALLVVSSCASATRKLVAVVSSLDRSALQRSLTGHFSEVLRCLLPLVAWNLDSLFLHIAYYRHAPEVQHDARLIRNIVNLFEDNFPDYQQAKVYATTKLLCDVALRAIP